MLLTQSQNGLYSLAGNEVPVYTARQEEKKTTAKIMEEPSDGIS